MPAPGRSPRPLSHGRAPRHGTARWPTLEMLTLPRNFSISTNGPVALVCHGALETWARACQLIAYRTGTETQRGLLGSYGTEGDAGGRKLHGPPRICSYIFDYLVPT
jgi:hypothetical protein